MDQLTVLPLLPGEKKDGWLPAAMGNMEFIARMDHAMRQLGLETGFRRLSENQFCMWTRKDPDVVLPIEEYRRRMAVGDFAAQMAAQAHDIRHGIVEMDKEVSDVES